MLTDSFYHEVVRKTVVAFGSLFNNLYVVRKNNTGKVIQRMKVPLAYGPKQKFLTRLDQDASRTAADVQKTSITLPRLGFEMTGLSYDATRKLNRVQKFKKVKGADNKSMTSQYMPVPYNIGFTLYCMAKNSDDALQIVEQILPYFQPDYTVTLNSIPSMEIVRDVPIILNDVSYEDSYDGDFTTRRVIMYTLSFTAKNYLYGPVTSQKVIKSVQVDQYTDMPVNAPKREQRLVVTPDPVDSDGDDNFGFNEVTSFFEDAKDFDPVSGTDK
tara:strand:+ start:623 stop:1435 length:813 start_codon:yes stop_codon:yes gene_type:complete